MDEKTWLRHPEYPNYEVSSEGEIRNFVTKHHLTGWIPYNGYRQVRLTVASNKTVVRSWHVIVASAYHGPRPPDHDVHHLAGQNDVAPRFLAYRHYKENRAEKHSIVRKGYRNGDYVQSMA
jgi:NUMOD4 motif